MLIALATALLAGGVLLTMYTTPQARLPADEPVATRRVEVLLDPSLARVLRFGPGELWLQLRDPRGLVSDPAVKPYAEAVDSLPGSTWCDGARLVWDGPLRDLSVARQAVHALASALVTRFLGTWFELAETLGLDVDGHHLFGEVDGRRLDLSISGGRVRARLEYGADTLVIARQEGPGDVAIGDPVLDRLHIEGPATQLAKLPALRADLMEWVHGFEGSVRDGAVLVVLPSSQAPSVGAMVPVMRRIAAVLAAP